MRQKRGGFLRRFVVLSVIGFGGWVFYKHGWVKINPKVFGGRFEHAVNQELSKQGLTDQDVLSRVNKEHGVWFLTWVETRRELEVPTQQRAQEIARGLEQVAHRSGCTVKTEHSSAVLTLQIKRYWWVIQRFQIVSPVVSGAGKQAKSPRVAFVIDDVAYETEPMDRFASLGVPLTFAILPRDKRSKELSDKAIALNFAVMLHLPMEPLDMVNNNPGPSGLYLKMSDQELKNQFEKDVASVPNLVGINNHMGSAFTESDPKMTLVMEWVKNRGLYFLDSRTSARSVVCKVAKRLGVPCLVNEVFLDNKDEVKDIEGQLDLVLQLALKQGQTIAIGHYRRKYLVQALENKLPEFKAHGVQIVTLPTFYPPAH